MSYPSHPHLHELMRVRKVLMAYCPTCQIPVHALPTKWERDVGWWLCFETRWDHTKQGAESFTVCQERLWVIEDQDAAEAAYHLGDWPAVMAMAQAQGPNV